MSCGCCGKNYSSHKLALAAGLLLSLSLTIATAHAAPGSPPTFTVNSNSDDIAAGPLDDGHCATVYNGGQPNGICTLRAAVMKANHWPGGGATIILPALPAGADYALTILMSGPDDETTGDLNVTANMSLRGGGAGNTIIDDHGGLTKDRAFSIGSGVVASLSGVTIEGGQVNGDGGGINNAGQLTLDHSAVISNTADNPTDGGGGIYNFLGTLTVTHSLIGGNTAHLGLQGGQGGGLDSYIGKVTIVASTISGNQATGGGIFSTTPNLTVYSSTIVANTSSDGGGLYGYGNGGVVTLLATAVISNSASNDGGGLDLKSGTANLVDSTVSGNSAELDGGGIYNSSDCTCGNPSEVDLFNATVANNFADAPHPNGGGTGGGVDTVASPDNTTKLQNSLVAARSRAPCTTTRMCRLFWNRC
jgi:hypothetical protein